MRSHRAFVRLSDQLAEAGFHTLRFDYTATGDSAGDEGEACLDDWLTDIQTAVRELRDISGIDKVSIVGLRLGAALAATAASSLNDIDSLILWDPVVDGANYIERLIAMHKDFVCSPHHFSNPQMRPDAELDCEELVGFRFPLKLRTSLSKLDLSRLPGIDVRRIVLISSEGQSEYPLLIQGYAELGIQTQLLEVQEQVAWSNVLEIDLVLTPHEVTNRIVELIMEDED